MEAQPSRSYTSLSAAIIIAAAVIASAILGSSYLGNRMTVTEISTITSTFDTTVTADSTLTLTGTATGNVTSVGGYESPSISAITLANTTVGGSPWDIAVDPSTNEVYVGGASGGMVVINATSGHTSSVPIPGGFLYLAVDPETDTIYANNDSCGPCSESVVAVNGSSNHVIGGVNLGAYIDGLAVNTDTNTVYASSADTDTLYVINGATNSLTKSIRLNGSAMGVAVDSKTNMVYVPVCTTNFACSPAFVYVINGRTNSIVSSIPIGLPFAIAVNQVTNMIYVTTSQNLLVSINGTTGSVSNTRLSAYALECRGLAVNSSTDEVYVACGNGQGLPSFFIVDGTNDNILNSFADNGSPMGVAFDPSNQMIYLANSNGYVLTLRSITILLP
jgi:DNA-binding beta-propeller fold protein YncE